MGGYGAVSSSSEVVGRGVEADAEVAGVAPLVVGSGTNVTRLVGDATAMDAIVLQGLPSPAADVGGTSNGERTAETMG
jgi:hypothetical protein